MPTCSSPGAYEYRFSPEEKKKKLFAISFDFKYDGKKSGGALFPLLMLAGPGQSGYESFPISNPGGEWKHYTLVVSGSSPRDILRIGMGTAGDELTYWFRNVKLGY